ncbi:hypothetical protein MRX96_011236 [Rhipicephalus microplus]
MEASKIRAVAAPRDEVSTHKRNSSQIRDGRTSRNASSSEIRAAVALVEGRRPRTNPGSRLIRCREGVQLFLARSLCTPRNANTIGHALFRGI